MTSKRHDDASTLIQRKLAPARLVLKQPFNVRVVKENMGFKLMHL